MLSTEALKSKGMYLEAAMDFMRMTSEVRINCTVIDLFLKLGVQFLKFECMSVCGCVCVCVCVCTSIENCYM